MARWKASIASHPLLGLIPGWAASRYLRALMLVNAVGMGLLLLWSTLIVWEFKFPASRPWLWAQVGVILAGFLGSLLTGIFSSALLFWRLRLRKPKVLAEV